MSPDALGDLLTAVLSGLARFSEDAPASEQPHLHDLIGSNGIMAITIRPDRGSQYQGVVPLEGTTLAEGDSLRFIPLSEILS